MVAYGCRERARGSTRTHLSCTINYVTETNPDWEPHPPRLVSERYLFAVEKRSGVVRDAGMGC